ncbi:MAG: lysylphosphatidylglycerol synthase domain-containing protein [Steroidobacteraceae bacterium]
MRLAARIALIVGLGVMILLIAHEGAVGIIKLLSQAGWTLLWLLPLHVLPLLLDAVGWRAIIFTRCKLLVLFLIAVVRQAVNGLLPVANIGGELVGIRLLARTGVDGTWAAASVIVEVLLTVVGQYLFVALGIIFLLQITQTMRLTNELLLGLAASAPVIALLIVLLRHGSIFERLQRIVGRFGPNMRESGVPVRGADVDAAIGILLRAPTRLARALGWQFAGLIAECVETWAALRFLGVSVGFSKALILESLTQAARQFIFIVPAGLGVQEIGLVAVGHVLGIGSDVAIALSLAKRMTRIVFGVPALLAWQWTETKGELKRARRSEG